MVVAVKIPNPKTAGSKAGRVQGLAQYIAEPQRDNATEKCIYFGTRGFLSKSLPSQIAEMIALAGECVKSKDPIRHDVITFKEGESPTAKQVEEIIDLYCKEMGLQDHQIIFGLHVDTDNTHIHIQANRVHPESFKAVKIDRGFDKEALQRVCARIEHAQGWKPENNSRYRVFEDGRISDRPERQERDAKPSPQAQGMETRTGIKSAERIVIEDATGILKSAKTWADVHRQLEQVGIRYERSGGGALFFVGDVAVKASVVERGARFAALQKKLGPFEPQNQEKSNAYFIHKLDRERAAERGREAKEQNLRDVQYLAKNGMRRLSECRVAITSSNAQSASARVLQIDARTSRREPEQLRRPESNASSRVDRSNEPLHDSLFRSRSGWHEYANARGEHYKNRRLDTEATRQRHVQEREALKIAQRAERSATLPKLRTGESRAGMTNALRSLLKFDQAKAKLDLKDRHAAERAALKVTYPQFADSYEQWLIERGETEKAQKWRYRENPKDEPCVIRGVSDVPLKKMDLRDFAGSIEGHHVRYVNRDGLGFVDRGRSIVIGDWREESVTLAALQLSDSKWGSFQVTGNDEYKALCVKLAAQHGFKINNPELQKGIQAQRDLLHQAQQRQAAAKQAEQAPVEHDVPPVERERPRPRGGFEIG
jgi:Relaxase/Mobilisation nuclease domain/Large polyvalent protein-associated domain 7